jgi:hypothetical protein
MSSSMPRNGSKPRSRLVRLVMVKLSASVAGVYC